MEQRRHSLQAFTLIEVMIVVAIIGLLLTLVIPNLVKSREMSQKNVCIANLRQLNNAIVVWAFENNHVAGDIIDPDALIGSTNYLRQMPICPAGGVYLFHAVQDSPQVSCTFDHLGHVLP